MDKVKARFYQLENHKFRCLVCAHSCLLEEGQSGLCGTRRVENGHLYLLNYGNCVAAAVDPIEKKPLYHYYPGKDILSLGTWGCNFRCPFCQNWSLAQEGSSRRGEYFTPQAIAEQLEKATPGCVGVAYTYNEPAIWFEYLYDVAKLAHQRGFANVLVTNGFLSSYALQELFPYLDALNVDVKAFREDFYRQYCRSRLEPVLETVENCVGKLHVELTYLVIPSVNDSREEISNLVNWMAKMDTRLPLHLSRYMPGYRFTLPPTPVETLEELRDLAKERLEYVYLGNVPGHQAANTYCPACSSLLIERGGFRALVKGISQGKCISCNQDIAVVGAG